MERIVLERNELVAQDGAMKARGTGEEQVIEAGLVFRAVGYLGLPVGGVPFDERRGCCGTRTAAFSMRLACRSMVSTPQAGSSAARAA